MNSIRTGEKGYHDSTLTSSINISPIRCEKLILSALNSFVLMIIINTPSPRNMQGVWQIMHFELFFCVIVAYHARARLPKFYSLFNLISLNQREIPRD
jgi:hypothetical protein